MSTFKLKTRKLIDNQIAAQRIKDIKYMYFIVNNMQCVAGYCFKS